MVKKVYVVQETGHDYTDANSFGEVIFLSMNGRDDFNNTQRGESNRRLVSHLRHGLQEFDQDSDYLICSGGSPYVSAAVFLILGRLGLNRIRLLRWDNRDLKYIPLMIELYQGAEQ